MPQNITGVMTCIITEYVGTQNWSDDCRQSSDRSSYVNNDFTFTKNIQMVHKGLQVILNVC